MTKPRGDTQRASDRSPGEDADLFDYALIGHCARFAIRSMRRHWLLSVGCVAVVLSLALVALKVLPKTYRVQTELQALRNPSLPTLANAGLYRPYEADAPTRAAKETVLRRDNLLALIKQTDLLNKWQAGRAPLTQFHDDMLTRLRGREPTQDEQVEMLVEQLEKRLTVDVAEGTVTLTLDWPNPTSAYDLVETASQNFLETRHTTEIAMVSDAISILESHAAHLQTKIDEAVDHLRAKERAKRATAIGGARRAQPELAAATAAPAPAVSEETIQLENQLAAKRRAMADLDDFRQKRVAELQAQLLQYQGLYQEKHPAIQSLRQNIEALSQPSPQIESLRAEIQQLERELMGRKDPGTIASVARTVPQADLDLLVPRADDVDPRDEYERSQVRMLFQNYGSVVDRIDAARVEMDAAQAAFKYRYGVISPPQMPKGPFRPSPSTTLAASLLGSLLLALLASVFRDLRSGVIMEGWQVERSLDLPVLVDQAR